MLRSTRTPLLVAGAVAAAALAAAPLALQDSPVKSAAVVAQAVSPIRPVAPPVLADQADLDRALAAYTAKQKAVAAQARAAARAERARELARAERRAQIRASERRASRSRSSLSTSSVSYGSPRAIARDMLAKRGQSDQFGCLDNLWTRESGWRTTASNPSGAYGIPQALPGSKMASAGADWRTNPATQIRWGLGYIDGRYGSPCNAWAHFQSRGWY